MPSVAVGASATGAAPAIPAETYKALSIAAPELGSKTLYANLGRAAGQADSDVFALIWNPQD